MTSPTSTFEQKAPYWSNVLFAVLLWGTLFLQLSFEWRYNVQYNYGLFIPFVGFYLIYLRWEDRPAPEPSKGSSLTLLLGLLLFIVLLHYPLKILFEANVDWRLIHWTQGLFVLLGSLFLISYWGGTPWVRHFILPICFLLFAIPWPKTAELFLIEVLLRFVTMCTVEVLNLLGIYAHQSANYVHLSTGPMRMAEACSGVRSFQSTLMLGYFLGELYRLGLLKRGILLVLAAFFAITLNVVRTMGLALIANSYGMDAMAYWHDMTGYFVFLGCLLILTFIALGIRGTPVIIQANKEALNTKPRFLSWPPMLFLIGLLLFTQPVVYLWYTIRQPVPKMTEEWGIAWNKMGPEVEEKRIPVDIQQTLVYDRGVMANWVDKAGLRWRAFFMEWDIGKAAQVAGFHSPELCLPSAGWTDSYQNNIFTWKRGDLELVFTTYTFEYSGYIIYVFYAQWDPVGYPYYEKGGRMHLDRFQDAWDADVKDGKKILQVIAMDAPSLEVAKKAFIQMLDRSVEIEKQP
tara:strand:- start:28516 stop:30066 length:1551 start_codon:yes stop_codon:yes gene_type:complete